ncbi:MAG TPA: outer membrane beta-barrel protein [Candidatus Acidoferrales bacterium]|nr:outer membrane beta-barrel protein [Candidatus Acidoferrales bacterium]
MRKAGCLLALCLLFGMAASAQITNKAEVYVGYQYTHQTYCCGIDGFNLQGAVGQGTYYFNSYFGVVGEFSGSAVSHINGLTATGKQYTYLFGPRLAFEHGPLRPYVQFLLGGAHLSPDLAAEIGASTQSGRVSQSGYAFAFGGGVDAKIKGPFYARLGQIDYLGTHYNDPFGFRFRQNAFRYSAGLVIHF